MFGFDVGFLRRSVFLLRKFHEQFTPEICAISNLAEILTPKFQVFSEILKVLVVKTSEGAAKGDFRTQVKTLDIVDIEVQKLKEK